MDRADRGSWRSAWIVGCVVVANYYIYHLLRMCT